MVKAVFHKNQRVFVAPVGTWAVIERVIPHWVKGIEEPLRIHYDCGLGRDFDAEELSAEQQSPEALLCVSENWSVSRRHNRWQSAKDSAGHPVPGTHPVVVTAENGCSGWRVPAIEYGLAPERYEAQARAIAATPKLLRMGQLLVELCSEFEDALPPALHDLAQDSAIILAEVQNRAAPEAQSVATDDLGADGMPWRTPVSASIRQPTPGAATPAVSQPALEKSAGPRFGRQDSRPEEPFVSPALRGRQATR